MLSIVTPPSTPLLDTAAAKLHLRVDHDDEDAYIDALVAAATGHLDGPQGILGRCLITQTLMALFDCFPDGRAPLRLSCPPLQTVSQIRYRDTAGDWQTMPASDYRAITSMSRRGFVEPAVGTQWPTGLADGTGNVEITYTAGYGSSAADAPAEIIHAVRLLLGHFYENREQVITGTIATEVPFAVKALVAPFEVHF